MKMVIATVLKILQIGVPAQHHYYKKYLLKKDVDGEFISDRSIKLTTFEVEETILRKEDEDVIESKVRSRGHGDQMNYSHEIRYVQEG